MPREWTPEQILELARQFQPACVLLAAAELNLFEFLKNEGRLCAADLAEAVGGDERGVTVLLDALAALEIVAKEGGFYRLPAGAAEFLTAGAHNTVLAMLHHQANCLRRWSELARVVKSGKAPPRTASIRGEQGDLEAFIGAMDNISAPMARNLISELGTLQFSHLLDVGGASGTWCLAWLTLYPGTQATLFDLPEVLPLAERRLNDAGTAARVRLHGGDYLKDSFPKGADLAWLSAIAHQQSREENRRLYSGVFKALSPGGIVLTRDVVMEESRVKPAAGALFAVNMLVGTASGGTFTFEEYKEDLEGAGFSEITLLRQDPGMNSVIKARKNAP